MTSWASAADGPSASVARGTRLGDRYVMRQPIASGGMAQVWLAEDTLFNRQVAAKVLHPHLATDAGFVTRFRREAVAAARLKHPAIVAILDTISVGGVEAIVMELIEGRTLRAELDELGAMPVDDVLHVGISIASALDEAHRAGIVHRDIKPANIMVADDGRVLVTDFGIAKAGTDADLTATGTLLGTAKYLAPEQVTGGPIDPRSDLFALGVVLFEALTGTVPFKADTDAATALARLHQDAPPVRHIRPNVPAELDAIVAKLVARRPEDRFARASMLQEALVRLRGNAGIPGPAAPGASVPGSPVDAGTGSVFSGSAGTTSRTRPPDPPPGTVQGPPLSPAARPPGQPTPASVPPPPAPGPVAAAAVGLGSVAAAAAETGPGANWGPLASSSGPHPAPLDAPPAGWLSPPSGENLAPMAGAGAVPPDQERVVRSGRNRVASLAAVALVVVLVGGALAAGIGPFATQDTEEPVVEEGAGLTITGLRSFDPLSRDAEKLEREDLVPLAIDGDPATAWATESYRSAGLAGLKAGVGLLLELDRSVPLNRLELLTSSSGWSMEVYVGDEFPPDPAAWGPPAATAGGPPGETVVELGGAEGSMVLLWLRDTGVTGDRFRFELAEVALR